MVYDIEQIRLGKTVCIYIGLRLYNLHTYNNINDKLIYSSERFDFRGIKRHGYTGTFYVSVVKFECKQAMLQQKPAVIKYVTC